MSPLKKGVDGFSGLALPYYGGEDNAPDFEKEHRAADDARADWRARINAGAEKFLDRYAAQEEAANRKRLIGRFGFPMVIAILALIAVVIAIAPN